VNHVSDKDNIKHLQVHEGRSSYINSKGENVVIESTFFGNIRKSIVDKSGSVIVSRKIGNKYNNHDSKIVIANAAKKYANLVAELERHKRAASDALLHLNKRDITANKRKEYVTRYKIAMHNIRIVNLKRSDIAAMISNKDKLTNPVPAASAIMYLNYAIKKPENKNEKYDVACRNRDGSYANKKLSQSQVLSNIISGKVTPIYNYSRGVEVEIQKVDTKLYETDDVISKLPDYVAKTVPANLIPNEPLAPVSAVASTDSSQKPKNFANSSSNHEQESTNREQQKSDKKFIV
jgi:hypothetical protein